MPDDLNPKRPDDLTPDAPSTPPQPVHPLNRRPPTPRQTPDGQPGPRLMRVIFSFTRPKRSTVTWALIIINIGIFAATALIPNITNDVVRNFASQPEAVLGNGEYWRLFTAMFLHGGIIHVMMNMLALYNLGSIMEITFGHARYLLIYLLGGLGGSILSAALNEPYIYSVGASGAVFALFGAEVAHLYANWRVLEPMGPGARLRLRQVSMLVALNLVAGFLANLDGGGAFSANIDNWAHIGGFAAGALLAYLIGPRYNITVSQKESTVRIDDVRPFRERIDVAIYAAAGLLGVLLLVVLLR